MKKLLLNLALLATISISLSACLHNDEEEDTSVDPSSFEVGTMNAKIDGAAWESKPFFGVQTSYLIRSTNYLYLYGYAIEGNTGGSKAVAVYIYGYDGPGTYTFGFDANQNGVWGYVVDVQVSGTNYSSKTHYSGGYEEETLGTGEIIITADVDDVVTGTFKFTTGKSFESNSEGTTTEISNAPAVKVTDGAFKITTQ